MENWIYLRQQLIWWQDLALASCKHWCLIPSTQWRCEFRSPTKTDSHWGSVWQIFIDMRGWEDFSKVFWVRCSDAGQCPLSYLAARSGPCGSLRNMTVWIFTVDNSSQVPAPAYAIQMQGSSLICSRSEPSIIKKLNWWAIERKSYAFIKKKA